MPKKIKTINPSTGEDIQEYEFMSTSEAKKAVEKCHQAFLSWKEKSHQERGEVLKKLGNTLKENEDKMAEQMTLEMGKPLKQAYQEIGLCKAICDYTAKNGPEEFKDEKRTLPNGGKGVITYQPIGVVYGIQPWNFPLYQVMRYTIANLMAGNGVLLKHADNVYGFALMLQEIIDKSALPDHLFTVLGIDHDQSDEIIEHELVRGVTFTGSPKGGSAVGQKAAKHIKKTVLELGSNDAYLVLSDADVEKAISTCVNGRIYNNGETCVAAKRFIVVKDRYEEFKEGFVKKMKALNYGDPKDSNNDIGPMARKDLRDELHEQVEKSVEKGAELLCGGKIPEGKGYFYPPTVLANLKKGQPAYDDELFGPAASLIKAKDDEDAMRIANDSRFGLGGGIFSENEDKAFELATKHFDTGMVFINSFGLAQPNMPFGGVKDSGYGREHGGFGLKEFVNTKAVMALNQ